MLLQGSPESDALGEEQLLALCFVLLVAGHRAQHPGALGNALLLLDRDRDARARLLANPGLLTRGVEEILRFEAPVHGPRACSRTTWRRRTGAIPKGARVHRSRGPRTATRAPFSEPDRFDIARSPNPHVSFGFGVHFCLGASLARMELASGSRSSCAARRFAGDTAGVVRLRSDTNRGFERLRS